MKDYSVPIPVVRSLKFLGQNLRQARIKRRLTMALVEERASITHVTLTKIEKGEVTVSMANYAKVMFVLLCSSNTQVLQAHRAYHQN